MRCKAIFLVGPVIIIIIIIIKPIIIHFDKVLLKF